MRYHYSRVHRNRTIVFILLIAVISASVTLLIVNLCKADDGLITCWAICKPGSYVSVRSGPSKNSPEVGRLDPCDAFRTDGTSKNGFIWADGITELGEGWIYCGFVSAERPEILNGEQYVSVSRKNLACRRWIGGPVIEGRAGWLHNGDNVQVFFRTSEWCVTNRGYIRSEWLEADPL